MEYRGINYDTGTKTTSGGTTRKLFDPEIVEKEIEIIKNELHCNAIRISGFDHERISRASEIALKMGLTVWYSPSLQYDSLENTFSYIMQGAKAAEILRVRYQNVIFVLGCELSLFTSGFVGGATGEDRLKNLFSPFNLLKNAFGLKRGFNKRLNKFLSRAVSEIKKQFHGQVSYASGTWEKVEWGLFDIIGIDLYRSAFNKATYIKELRNYKNAGKPLCIMEFGCCCFTGADGKGALGWTIADWKKAPPELKGAYTRNESTQAEYLLDLLNIFEKEGVQGAFIFTFVMYNYLYNDDPRYDLDMASYGIVRSMIHTGEAYYRQLPWIPKKAFFEAGNFYKEHLPSPGMK